jgi:hypothetical protein
MKKKPGAEKPLKLHKETLRRLTEAQMQDVEGGSGWNDTTYCGSNGNSDPCCVPL